MGTVQKREAMLYEALADGKVRCRLCGHECVIGPDGYGICRVRRNVGGKLVSVNYDALVAVHIDPIEKKPLFHFLPGTQSLSVAAAGCNFRCAFCQNWQISQAPAEGRILGGQDVPPAKLVAEHCQQIAESEGLPVPAGFNWLRYVQDLGGNNIRDALDQLPATLRKRAAA